LDNNWINILRSEDLYKVEIITQMLKNNKIDAVIINQKDSSYNMFGYSNLYVKREHVEKSVKLIQKHNE
jgi:hypothetical protein|tara:strand:+ start:38412 stop:38618 length:207 start_codon:yes stop_codon:yes gene_type:complete